MVFVIIRRSDLSYCDSAVNQYLLTVRTSHGHGHLQSKHLACSRIVKKPNYHFIDCDIFFSSEVKYLYLSIFFIVFALK